MAERWQKWMPFDIDPWQGSANVQALSDLAYRAVHNLILDMWKQDDCALANDDKELAKRSRVAARWKECREEVMDYFADRTPEGKITHRVTLRLWDEARKKYEEGHAARVEAGKKGAAKRWTSKAIAELSESYSKPIANDGNNTVTVTTTETSTEEQIPSRAASRAQCELVYDAYPRKVGKEDALRAIGKAVARLQRGEDLPCMEFPEALEYLRKRAQTFARSPAGSAGEYTPHPATWFNKGRYLDDETEWQGRSNGTHQQHRSSRAEQALAELGKAGVHFPAGWPEAGPDQVRSAPGRSGGRDPSGVVLEGAR